MMNFNEMVKEDDKKFLVQAILSDGDFETVIDSIKTDDSNRIIEFLMKKHKSSRKYTYIVMDILTQEIVMKTTNNKYAL